MRIGRQMLEVESMTIEELTIIINELRAIRKRKQEEKDCLIAMKNALIKAKENGFIFIDKDFGNIIEEKDIDLFDERACRK